MGYMHIDNLYKDQTILMFKECYALEKIHGTSAHIDWAQGYVGFYSGGEKREKFVELFNKQVLEDSFKALGHDLVTVFGEAYGGKQQGMKAMYGEHLKFVVFDIKIGEHWLKVPDAHAVAQKLGLEFVHYWKTSTDIVELDKHRDAPSEQAFRNGCANRDDTSTYCIMEGVVLRPLLELRTPDGSRIIAKHKRAEFRERQSIPDIDPSKRQLMEDAEKIALEWVTDMRLRHVLDKMGNPKDITKTGEVIRAMVEDVTREASGEIMDNKSVRRAIGNRACKLYKEHAMKLEEPVAC